MLRWFVMIESKTNIHRVFRSKRNDHEFVRSFVCSNWTHNGQFVLPSIYYIKSLFYLCNINWCVEKKATDKSILIFRARLSNVHLESLIGVCVDDRSPMISRAERCCSSVLILTDDVALQSAFPPSSSDVRMHRSVWFIGWNDLNICLLSNRFKYTRI